MNFQVLPWTWLRRATALHGALHGVRVTAIPTKAMQSEIASAKGRPDSPPSAVEYRYAVDADKTLAAFEQRFDSGSVFRSPSEICEMFLVPKRIPGHVYDGAGSQPADPSGMTADELMDWWNGQPDQHDDAFEATGDNLRESPYAQLYSRLCTQSNVYRVHYRVQVLKKARSVMPERFDVERDAVVAEKRGSSVVERQLDRSQSMDDPVSQPDAVSLHVKQRFVIVSQEAFTP